MADQKVLTQQESGLWHHGMLNLIPVELLETGFDFTRYKESITGIWQSHEALRAQLAEAQTSVLALAEVGQKLAGLDLTRDYNADGYCPSCYCRNSAPWGEHQQRCDIAQMAIALARPGVVAVMKEAADD